MKIAIVSNRISNNIGGSEIFAERLFNKLKIKNKTFFSLVWKKPKFFRKILLDYFNPLNYFILRSFFLKNKIELMNFHNLYGLDAFFIRKINNYCPIIITSHDTFLSNYSNKFHSVINRIHQKILLSNLKSIPIIVPSKFLYEKLKSVGYKKIKIINNGIDIPEKSTNYKRKILFVGRLSPEKGLQTIINVLNQIKDYEVLVLGEGPLKEELESKYKNVKFLGFQNPKKYYLKGSILVYPSICQENQPLTILEAVSHGLCIIGSDIGGIPELIKHKKTGLLFKPGDEKDFAEKLNYLLKNPSEIKRIGKNAREFVKKNFSWDKVIEQYEKLYNEVIEEFKTKNNNIKKP